jgi:hypothetical protein
MTLNLDLPRSFWWKLRLKSALRNLTTWRARRGYKIQSRRLLNTFHAKELAKLEQMAAPYGLTGLDIIKRTEKGFAPFPSEHGPDTAPDYSFVAVNDRNALREMGFRLPSFPGGSALEAYYECPLTHKWQLMPGARENHIGFAEFPLRMKQ